MASLVLGAVGAFAGSFVGMPALGWAIGSALGSALFPGGKDTRGPTLSDLKMQVSQYGMMIPIAYSTVRIAGNVIWQTDLVPHEHEEEVGKGGGPTHTTTSYSASFAILLCEGPIQNVRKIWADSRIIYDATETPPPVASINDQTLLDPLLLTSDDWNYHVRHPETWPLVEVTEYVNQQRNNYSEGGINYDAGWSDAGYAGAFVTGEGALGVTLLPAVPFTLYLGDEEQGADPTMEAALGVGNVPGYRGRAYIVFTDMDLSEFSNRIPIMTFEVLTRAHTNGALRLVAVNNDEPITFRSGAFAVGLKPVITQWGLTGDVHVRELGTTVVHTYLQNLDYKDDPIAATVVDSYPSFILLTQSAPPPPYDHWDYYSVGTYVINGNTVPIWCCPGNPVMVGNTFPTICATNVHLNAADFPESNYSLAEPAGIPVGEYVGSIVISRDKLKMMVFTAPTVATGAQVIIDKWYLLVNAVVTSQGTVDPPLGMVDLPIGHAAGNFSHMAGMLENNAKWMWVFWGAGTLGGTCYVYNIDSTGNFAFNDVCGTLGIGDPLLFGYPSTFVLSEGYCGVAVGQSLGIFSRFPVTDTIKMPLSEIVSNLSIRAGLTLDQHDVTELTDEVDGYVIANQTTVRSAIEPLQPVYHFDGVELDDRIKFFKRDNTSIVTIPDDDLAAHHEGEELPALLQIVRNQEVDLPEVVNVVYMNLDADYQNGTQVARRMVTASREALTLEMPLVLSDAKAKQVADALLFNAHLERTGYSFATTRKYSKYVPCNVATVQGHRLRIVKKVEAGGVIKWTAAPMLGRVFEQDALTLTGTGGAAPSSGFTPPVITPSMRTTLILLDLPLLPGAEDAFGSYIVMGGSTSGSWPGATLYKSVDDGVTYTSVATDVTADTWGSSASVLGDFTGGNVFDESNVLTVVIVGSGTLSSATEILVLNGANLASIGHEVIQFKNAVLTAPQTYQLTGLLRGRLGTEWAIGTHAFSEKFVLLSGLTFLPSVVSEVNVSRKYKAVTLGQTLANTEAQDFTNTGVALKPYSLVLLGGGSNAAGDVTLNGVRRTRVDGSWVDGGDIPLGETSERYVVQIWDSTYSYVARIDSTLTSPTFVYTAAMQITDFGDEQETVYFTFTQIGALLGRISRGTASGLGSGDDLPITPIAPYSLPVTTIPSGAVNMTLTWSDDTDYTTGFTVGDTFVAQFTTGGGTPSGYIILAEYVDPPRYRHAMIATDAAGTNILAERFGNSPTIFFGANPGYANLAPSTTYYFIVRNEFADGTPSGTIGDPANGVVQLNGA